MYCTKVTSCAVSYQRHSFLGKVLYYASQTYTIIALIKLHVVPVSQGIQHPRVKIHKQILKFC